MFWVCFLCIINVCYVNKYEIELNSFFLTFFFTKQLGIYNTYTCNIIGTVLVEIQLQLDTKVQLLKVGLGIMN